jgi:hypothetical protein
MSDTRRGSEEDDEVTKRFEEKQKSRAREFRRRQIMASLYQGLLVGMSAAIKSIPTDSGKTLSNEQIARDAYDIAKWGELVWLEENPESDDDIQFRYER